MADNYFQFSEEIKIWTPEEKAWFQDWLKRPDERDDFPTDEKDQEAYLEKWRRLHGVDEAGEEAYYPDFDYDLGDSSLWVRAPESGNANQVAVMIQQFLKKFHPNDHWTLTWSETCSKMRLGEFSGGGVLVTAKKLYWCDPYSFFDRIRERLKPKKAGKKGKKR